MAIPISSRVRRDLSTRRGFSSAAPDDLIAGLLPYLLLGVMAAVLGFVQPATLTTAYVQNVVNLSLVLMLIAFGQGIVTLSGGIDLSVPGVVSVVNAVAASTMSTPGRTGLVSAALLFFGWLPGVINGWLIVRGRMQPFIVTLATWFIWGGIAFYVLPGPGGQIDEALPDLVFDRFLGLSGTTWILFALLLFAIWFGRTRLGLSIRAIGSDRVSASHAGVALEGTEVAAYALSSWFAVLGGVLLSFQSMSGEPTAGNSYILPMITAVVVGGINLSGGKGSMVGPIVGALVLAYLTGVTFSFRLQPQWNQIFQGLLLVLSIAATTVLQRLALGARDGRSA